MESALKKLDKYKYLLLVLFVGLVLMLLPSRSQDGGASSSTASQEEARLEEVLGSIAGVGRICVLRSEEGVVVVCEGAASPQVRLHVTQAVSSYTEFGSDRITVIEMKAC